MIAQLFLIRMIAPRARATKVNLWCDNLGVVYMINKLATRSTRCAKIIDEILWLAAEIEEVSPTRILDWKISVITLIELSVITLTVQTTLVPESNSTWKIIAECYSALPSL